MARGVRGLHTLGSRVGCPTWTRPGEVYHAPWETYEHLLLAPTGLQNGGVIVETQYDAGDAGWDSPSSEFDGRYYVKNIDFNELRAIVVLDLIRQRRQRVVLPAGLWRIGSSRVGASASASSEEA